MDLMKMWNDGGIMMQLLVLPAMLGTLTLGAWQLIAARRGIAPKLHQGAVATLLAAGLLAAGIAQRLVLGVLAAAGAKPELILNGLRVTLYPLFFAVAAAVILGVLRLGATLRTVGTGTTSSEPGIAVRCVASLALTSLALTALLLITEVLQTSAAPEPGVVLDAARYASMLYRLNSTGLALGVLTLVLGLATMGMSLHSRGGAR